MSTADAGPLLREQPVPDRIPAFEFIDVHTQLGGQWVLKGVTFSVPSGGVTALLGASGGGKTTCIRHLLSLSEPDHGTVLIEGRRVAAMKQGERRALHRRFGVVLQGGGVYGSALWESMSVMDNLLHQLGSLRPGLSDQEQYRLCLGALREVGMAEHMAAAPSWLSGGEKKRVALARALVAEPEFAVLDSFDMGIDGVRLVGTREVIRRHHRWGGGTYLIATHNMELVRNLADHVIVLARGTVVAQGTMDEVFQLDHPAVRQLIEGAVDGPLGMASGEIPPRPRPHRDRVDVPVEIVPIPLVVLILLVALTAAGIAIGAASNAELYVLVATWVLSGGFLIWYYLGSGSDYH